MSRLSWPQLLLSLVLFYLFLGQSQANRPPGDRSFYVFRGDTRSPEQIHEDGGFAPWQAINYTDPRSYSLWDHVNAYSPPSAYISTSRSFGQSAVHFARGLGPGSYVYRIRITPNMIDVNNVFPRGPYPFQQELSALGGIPWDAVEGWFRMPDENDSGNESDFDLDAPRWDNTRADDYTARYERDFEARFTRNSDYVAGGREGTVVQGLDNPDVAILGRTERTDGRDMIDAARRFMNRYGRRVGWVVDQDFPLWRSRTGAAQTETGRSDDINMGQPSSSTNRSSSGQSSDLDLDQHDIMDIAEFLNEYDFTCEEASGAYNDPVTQEANATLFEAVERMEVSSREALEEDRLLREALELLHQPSCSWPILRTCGFSEPSFMRKRGMEKTDSGPKPAKIRRVCEKLRKGSKARKERICGPGKPKDGCEDGERFRYDLGNGDTNPVDQVDMLSEKSETASKYGADIRVCSCSRMRLR
ncbi:putative enterotoxin [Ophiocordyceps camponoti-rufipedis]|uniref:Putative enterotoxin n=1 Tax=Ophiocordyceps camponoti-rufipedis TaxID=2004952 RepID=A0A2C5ZBY9_9HYPO|nr:putative enterotoxin [Ophiocordyceps camponoti-rufipedis]